VGGTQPFTFQQPFKQGDIPAGNYPTSSNATLYYTPCTYWSDGSLRTAIFSGVSTFTANVPKAIELETTTVAPSGSNVAEPTSTTAVVTITGDGAGTYALDDFLGVDRSTWSLGDGGCVRSILNPGMSEFHYYIPTSDAHLTLWAYVRQYASGAREIEFAIENGWLNVSSPGGKTYSVDIQINGSSVYQNDYVTYQNFSEKTSQTTSSIVFAGDHEQDFEVGTLFFVNGSTATMYEVDAVDYSGGLTTVDIVSGSLPTVTRIDIWRHCHHTRWSWVAWETTDPQITFTQDPAYLRNTRLLPNYPYQNPTSAAFSGLASAYNPVPFTIGNWSPSMGDAGYQPPIGLLPQWETVYVASGDEQALAAVLSNSRCAGRWGIYYRDETTGRAPIASDYPGMTMGSGWGTPPPAATGGAPGWDTPHCPSNGYLAYLVEGRWSQLESQQFAAIYSFLDSNPTYRLNGAGTTGLALACVNSPITTRGWAWAFRNIGQAAGATPTVGLATPDAAVQESLVEMVQDTASWNKERYITGSLYSDAFRNDVGWIGQYDRYSGGSIPSDEWYGGAWMVRFQGMALGHVGELGIEGVDVDLADVRDFVLKGVVDDINQSNTIWNYQNANTYDRPYLKDSSDPSAPVFMTNAEAFASYKSTYSLDTLSTDLCGAIKKHGSNDDMEPGDTDNSGNGYASTVGSCLAFAKDALVAGASDAFTFLTLSSNWYAGAMGASDAPQFAIWPRKLPTYLGERYEWVQLPGPSTLTYPSPAVPGSNPYGSIWDAWGGGWLRTLESIFGGWGGGHADGSFNGIMGIRLEVNSPAWEFLFSGTPAADIIPNSYLYLDGNPAPIHGYCFEMWDNRRDQLRILARGQYDVGGFSAANYTWTYGEADWDANTIYSVDSGTWKYSQPIAQAPNCDVYCINEWRRTKWENGVPGTWTTPIPDAGIAIQDNSNALFDIRRRLMVSFGMNDPDVYTWNVDTNASGLETLTGADAADLCYPREGVGTAYDPVQDLYFVYPGRGEIYKVDPANNFLVTKLDVTGEKPPDTYNPGTKAPNVYGKFQFAPILSSVVLQPAFGTSLFVMKVRAI